MYRKINSAKYFPLLPPPGKCSPLPSWTHGCINLGHMTYDIKIQTMGVLPRPNKHTRSFKINTNSDTYMKTHKTMCMSLLLHCFFYMFVSLLCKIVHLISPPNSQTLE